ncbi:hypothetical protein NMY22_g551 [Coprinellus aureogranulatus]|nr:hypothetical protein NMY22_g551 [Coprinellus aureogranulatus]
MAILRRRRTLEWVDMDEERLSRKLCAYFAKLAIALYWLTPFTFLRLPGHYYEHIESHPYASAEVHVLTVAFLETRRCELSRGANIRLTRRQWMARISAMLSIRDASDLRPVLGGCD